jgi:hypothetical protein
LENYSIAEFLAALTDDDFTKEMITLFSEGYSEELLLEKLLELMKRKQKC